MAATYASKAKTADTARRELISKMQCRPQKRYPSIEAEAEALMQGGFPGEEVQVRTTRFPWEELRILPSRGIIRTRVTHLYAYLLRNISVVGREGPCRVCEIVLSEMCMR